MREPTEETPLAPQAIENPSRWTRERIFVVALNSYNVFLWSAYLNALVPLLPLVARRYGFGSFEQGVVLACVQLGWFVGLPFVNKAYVKPRTMVYLGAVAFTSAPAIIACHPAFWTICVSRVVEGFGICLLLVLMTSVMIREIPEEMRGFAFGVKGGFAALGFFFGPIAGGVLYPYGGLRLIVIVLTAMALPLLLAYVLVMPNQWFVSYEARIAAFEAGGISLTARFSSLLQDRLLNWLFCTHFFAWFFLGIIFMAVPQFMVEELALGSTQISIFWLASDMSRVLGSVSGGFLADYLKSWDAFFGGLLLQHIGQFALIVLASQSTPNVFLLCFSFVFIFGTTEDGILGPSFMKMITSLEARQRERAKGDQTHSGERFEEILSMMEFITAVAMTLGPLYAGSVYDTLGFSMTLLGFTFVSTIANGCSAYSTFQLRDMAPIIASKV